MLWRLSHRLVALLIVIVAIGVLAAACDDDGDGDGDGAGDGDTPEATSPAGTEDVPGVTDTEIVLGTHFPLSGHAAAIYSPIATAGMTGYFDYVNDMGGVHGRQIELIIEDDHYSPPDAAEAARRLVERNEVFAILGGLGTASHSAVAQYLEDQGVPDMFVLSGATKWTEPVVRTRFGGNPDYVTEGTILGLHIAENYPGEKLGLIIQNDDFGLDGARGLREGLADSDVEVLDPQTFEAAEADLTGQVQRARNDGATVLAVYGIPTHAANVVRVARTVLEWDVPIIITGVSADPVFLQLAGPENAEGIVSVVFAKQVYETDDPGVAQHIEIMEQYGGGVEPSNITLVGHVWAELMVEVLERTGPDLTRDTMLDAAESLRGFECSVCLVPISMSPTDHRPFEIERYARVEDGQWVPFGEPVNFESTPE